MGYLDFAAIKEAVSIEEAVRRLNLRTRKAGNQFRAPCPACKQGGDRALAITPAKSLFYCFAGSTGGDQIALVAHIMGKSVKEAAEWLAGTRFPSEKGDVSSNSTVRKDHATGSPSPEGFPELEYLEPAHEAVEALGLPVEVAQALGAGYAPKGVLRGTVAIPLRLPSGVLIGYAGATELKLPSRYHGLPEPKVVPLQSKKTA